MANYFYKKLISTYLLVYCFALLILLIGIIVPPKAQTEKALPSDLTQNYHYLQSLISPMNG